MAPIKSSLIFGLALVSFVVGADVQLNYVAGDGDSSRQVHMLLGSSKLKTVLDNEAFTVWDSKRQSFTHVMHERQQFIEVDEATITQMLQLAAGIVALGGQKAEVLQNVENEAKIARELIAKPEKSKIAGLNCQMYSLVENGKDSAEMCMVSAHQLGLTAQDLSTFKSLWAFGQKLAHSFLGPKLAKQPRWLEGVGSDLFPIRYRSLQGDKWVTDMELVSMEKTTVSPELFAVPEGYRPIGLPLTLGR